MNILSAIYDLLHKGVEVFEKFWDECTEAENIVAANRVANMNYNQAEEKYALVLEIFYSSLSNCAQIINAKVPRYMEKCIAIPKIRREKTGAFVYRFWFYCHRGYSQTNQQIQRVIQNELNQECYSRGLSNLAISSVHINTDGRVFINIFA